MSTTSDTAKIIGISHEHVLTYENGMKNCGKWVPHLLSSGQKAAAEEYFTGLPEHHFKSYYRIDGGRITRKALNQVCRSWEIIQKNYIL